jgi:hypothetical protein
LRGIRARVWKARSTSTLFDVRQYCADIESLYESMWRRYVENAPLDHITHLSAYKDNTSINNAITNRTAHPQHAPSAAVDVVMTSRVETQRASVAQQPPADPIPCAQVATTLATTAAATTTTTTTEFTDNTGQTRQGAYPLINQGFQ